MSGVRCAVLGDPIEHSLSPVLHRAGYAARGLEATYEKFLVREGNLATFVAGLDDTWRGLSCTMPLKREVMAVADELSPRAAAVGVGNTLVRRADGTWLGDNTDVPGAVNALRAADVHEVRRTAIWGAGATAVSCLWAAAELGCRDFTVYVRTPERATPFVAAAQNYPEPLEVRVARLGDPVEADLLVSTIPAHAQGEHLTSIRQRPVVFDVLYHPWPTPIASVESDRIVGGLDLLVHQAALQFELFVGLPAPLAEMYDAGRRALEARA